jgi:hypothetical protein
MTVSWRVAYLLLTVAVLPMKNNKELVFEFIIVPGLITVLIWQVKHLFQNADMNAVTLHNEEERAVMQNIK